MNLSATSEEIRRSEGDHQAPLADANEPSLAADIQEEQEPADDMAQETLAPSADAVISATTVTTTTTTTVLSTITVAETPETPSPSDEPITLAADATATTTATSSTVASTVTEPETPVKTDQPINVTDTAVAAVESVATTTAVASSTLEPPTTADQHAPQAENRQRSNQDEAKEEIEDPPTVRNNAASSSGAYDFGSIQQTETQDTVGLAASMSMSRASSEEEELEDTDDAKPLLLSKPDLKVKTTFDDKEDDLNVTPTTITSPGTSPTEQDGDHSVSSQDTATLQTKRLQERRCGIYICLVGLMGVIAACILLAIGFSKDNDNDKDSVETTRPTSRPTFSPTTLAPTLNPVTTAPTVPPTLYLNVEWPPVTLAALDDPTSPQSQAYQWLLDDPKVSSYSEKRVKQRFSLATLYYATDGEQWASAFARSGPGLFLSYIIHECDWMQPLLTRNETCTSADEYLAVVLPSRGLSGEIPPEIPMFLPELLRLELEDNRLTGSLTTYIGNAQNLLVLDVRANTMVGPLPTELGLLSNRLERLTVDSNDNLDGVLPSELGQLTAMTTLGAFATALGGTIPTEFGNLERLQTLHLQDNALVGFMPPELFGAISSEGVVTIDVIGLDNDGTATVRQSNTNVTKGNKMALRDVRLDGNQLTGQIPSVVGSLSQLIGLRLGYNQLTSVLPAELLQLSLLEHLYVNDNPQLEGQLSSDAFDGNKLVALQELDITNTSITGVLPATLCSNGSAALTVLDFTCSSDPENGVCGCECECFGVPPTVEDTLTPTQSPVALTMAPTQSATAEVSMGETVDATMVETVLETEETSTVSPTASPTVGSSPGEFLDLPEYTLEALRDPNSPQSQALRWLENDPIYDEYSVARKQQRFSLATLAYSATSDTTAWLNSTGWLSSDHECDWFSDPTSLENLNLESPCEFVVNIRRQPRQEGGSVSVMTEERQYVALLLPTNGLQGNIPPEIAMLSELRTVDMSGNLLLNQIPPTLGDLAQLEDLNLGLNFLQGSRPSQIGKLSSLLNLAVWANRLTGAIPSELGLLHQSLLSVSLSDNHFNQTIPSELGALSGLQRLWLHQNDLAGPLPVELGNCGALKTLQVSKNEISGESILNFAVSLPSVHC